jgi:hypothetical protein
MTLASILGAYVGGESRESAVIPEGASEKYVIE